MAIELFVNNARTTLNGSITNSATTLVVTDASAFPTSGNFRLLIDSELMLVTGVSGTTFTVTRGAESTTAASHTSGVTIACILTKGALDNLRSDLISTGAYSALPAAAINGRLYFPNDGVAVHRDTGAAWAAFGPIFPLTTPIDSQFAWVNQGGASVIATSDYIHLSAPASGTANLRIRKKAAPTAPYKITMRFSPLFWVGAASAVSCGPLWRESSSGKLISMSYQWTGSTPGPTVIGIYKWTNETTFSATYVQITALHQQTFCFRMEDDNTNRIFSYSTDGFNFFTVHSVGRTDFITANEVGFYVSSDHASNPAGMTVYSWLES